MSCRPPPPEDHRRDLIGAWQQPRVRRVRRSPLRQPDRRDDANDRDRDGHTQAHAHLRRGRRVYRGRARGGHGAGAHGELRQAAALGASARRRAGVGDRGLPARVRRVRAVPDRARRADRASRTEAHGGRAPLITRAWQVRLDRRVQRRSRCAEGRDREPHRGAPGRRGARHSPAGRPSRGSDRRTHRRPAAAALAPARPLARARDPRRGAGHQQVAREDLPPPRPGPANDARAGRARARAPDRRAHDPHPRTRVRARRARRQLRAAAARRARVRSVDRSQADRRDRGRRPLRHRRQARAHRRSRADPRLLRPDHPPPPGPRRQPPAQLRATPPRRQQGQLGPRHRRLPQTQAGRGEVAQGGAALPQTPPRPARLETPIDPGDTRRLSGRPPARRFRNTRRDRPYADCPA
jgi:hypothetical protein